MASPFAGTKPPVGSIATPMTSAPAAEVKRVMASFYLSPQAVDKLDRVWLARRMKDRKVQKSQIIEELIMTALKGERLLLR